MSMSPARQRLRAFEDATFGADTSRIRGEIERGTGSAFARLDEATRKKFAALDRLIVAEDAAAAALKSVEAATKTHDAAMAKLHAAKNQADLPATLESRNA